MSLAASGDGTLAAASLGVSGLARALFEQSPFSSVIYDAAGRPIAVNAAFRTLWGIGLESVPPDYTVLTDPELERQGALPHIHRAFAGELVVSPPVRYDIARISATGTGRTVWTQGHFSPVRDETGQLTNVVLTHIDLTAQKDAEEAIRASEERMRLAQHAAHIGVFDWHIPSGSVTWTEEEERIFGLEPGTFEGTIAGWTQRVLPDDVGRMQHEMADHMARREREMTFTFRIRRPDGEVRRIEGRATFLYADDGTPLRMVGVNLDVTDRARMDEALREGDAQLRETQQIARLGSWRWDVATGELTWDPMLCELYGVAPEEAPRDFAGYLALVHPEDRELALQNVERSRAPGEPLAFDHRVLLRDGSVRYLHGRGRTIVGADGTPVRMLGSSQDVTERKRAEAELARLLDSERRARADAEAANRAKSDFLAKMSHELRTPLNAIGGYSELLDMGIHGPVTPEQREALDRIQRNQRYLLALINDILDFSKIEVGAVRLAIGDVEVREVIASLDTLIGPQFRAKGVRYDVQTCSPEMVLRADRERVVQICLNLLSNSLKATPAGGAVTLWCEPATTGVVAVCVRDTGVGIPADKLEVIFNPFTQIGRTFSNPGTGVGLGLAISRELARAMGGDLVVSSEPGAGATFTLTLPSGKDLSS